MMDGDWGWYLDTYSTDRSGMRAWVKDGQLLVQVYRDPEEFQHHPLTHVSFAPTRAPEEDRHRPRAKEVRWGIVTCLRKDLADLLGPVLLEHATVGRLQVRGGAILRNWIPVILKHHIEFPLRQMDDAKAIARRLKDKPLYESARYSLIVRDDVFQIIRGFHFDGCCIVRCHTPPG